MSENLLVPVSNRVTLLPGLPDSAIKGGTLTEVIFGDGTRYSDLAFHGLGDNDHYPGFTDVQGNRLEPPQGLPRDPVTRLVIDALAGIMADHHEVTGSFPAGLLR
jgi:hypothetical protein